MESVVWGGTQWDAVGWDPYGNGRAWVSADGIDWVSIPGPDLHGSAPEVAANLFDVAATPAGLVAVGAIPDDDHSTISGDIENPTFRASVWISDSGDRWERIDPEAFVAEPEADSIAATPSGSLVVFGYSGTWRADQPTEWRRLDTGAAVPPSAAESAWSDEIGIAVGWDLLSRHSRASVWETDDDGMTWRRVPPTLEAFAGGDVYVQDVAFFEDGLVAVGGDLGSFATSQLGSYVSDLLMIPDDGVGMVWVGTIEE
jgi:hypothetical protein